MTTWWLECRTSPSPDETARKLRLKVNQHFNGIQTRAFIKYEGVTVVNEKPLNLMSWRKNICSLLTFCSVYNKDNYANHVSHIINSSVIYDTSNSTTKYSTSWWLSRATTVDVSFSVIALCVQKRKEKENKVTIHWECFPKVAFSGSEIFILLHCFCVCNFKMIQIWKEKYRLAMLFCVSLWQWISP